MRFSGSFLRASLFLTVLGLLASQYGCQRDGVISKTAERQISGKDARLDSRKKAVVQGTKAGDFQIYVTECLGKIMTSWESLNPDGYDKTMRGASIFRITVQDGGDIIDVKILESSGDSTFDSSIFSAIERTHFCGPFPINLATGFSEVTIVQTFFISS